MEAVLEGFGDLTRMLSEWTKKASEESAAAVVGAAAEAFVRDVRALPAPRSALGGAHTHLLDTVTAQRDGKDYLVGWGKYYGPMVERGTRSMQAQPHLLPTWRKNERKYLAIMRDEFLRRK